MIGVSMASARLPRLGSGRALGAADRVGVLDDGAAAGMIPSGIVRSA